MLPFKSNADVFKLIVYAGLHRFVELGVHPRLRNC